MSSYVPEVVKKNTPEAVKNLPDTVQSYNPLAERNRPSVPHGQYTYVKGIVNQTYGELTQQSSYVATGGGQKASGVAEMQAARARQGLADFGNASGMSDAAAAGQQVVSDTGEGVYKGGREGVRGVNKAGEGVATGVGDTAQGFGGAGKAGVQTGGDAARGVGEAGTQGVQGVGNVGKQGGEAVASVGGRGVEGVQGAGEGIGKSLGGLFGRK